MPRPCIWFAAALVGLSLGPVASAADEAAPAAPVNAPGLGDPGTLTGIAIETGHPADAPTKLRGADARQQLLVTGLYSSGQMRDLTRAVQYAIDPAERATVDATGMVVPLTDGEATVTATTPEGHTASVRIAVESMTQEIPVNFPNQIVPIFTKLGCNSGGCHGKASGQNGFKLSLLGFEPGEDYEYLVKEGRGRRLFPAAPDRSLLMLKATNAMPHGGGHRLAADSHEYRLLRRWIAQGMPFGREDDPTVAGIEVFPPHRTMDRATQQQVVVVAHYTDGSIEDVTRVVQFNANDTEMGDVSVTGLVETLDLTGDVAVMARYQGQVGVFRASVPLGVPVDSLPPSRNFIDDLVFAKLKVLGLPPSAPCDNATFLRRVTIDITGRLPTQEETSAFLADADPNKRDRWIDTLLASPDYADYFANKWSAVLKNKRGQQTSVRSNYGFHAWIRESLHQNKPYDQFVREILAASGDVAEQPPVVWYNQVREVNNQVEDTAQLFLGLRIQCARCHHHPFEKWSQQDYYGLAAFFSRVSRKTSPSFGEERIYHRRGEATAQNPKTGRQVVPTGLGGEPLELSIDDDPRQALVDWMAEPSNPFFARALTNRYWKHFFNRGIVDPEDDMRVTNPASNDELLSALAQHFVASGFDLKDLVRTICRSSTYQLSAEPNAYNQNDKQNFSRFYPRRLNAEVLLDSIDQVTASSSGFSGLPAGTRAVELPDQSVGSYFLTVFGKPQGESACECERSSEANLAQSLHLLNSSEIQGKLSQGGGRAALLAQDSMRSDEDKVRELYLWVYSREPVAEELQIALAHLAKHEQNKQVAYEDILWALINTKEFLFNH
jgi:hypothetical protein